jgi:hypothetical protein
MENPRTKQKSVTTEVIKQLEGHPAEPEAKKLRLQPLDPEEATGEEKKDLGNIDSEYARLE